MTVREMVEFRKRYGMVQDVTLDDVTVLTVASFDRANGVCDLLENHGYTTNALPGEFIKEFTMNANEIAELEQSLTEIDALNLKDVFQSNLRVACFKKTFLDRLKVFLTNNLAFLNEDNTFIHELYDVSFASRVQFCIDNGFIFMNGNRFIKELYDAEDFGSYTAGKPLQEIRTVEELNRSTNGSADDLQAKMDAEDIEVYHKIVEELKSLREKNPTDVNLSMLVNNVVSKIVPSLINKDYHVYSLRDVVRSVMFEGIDVTPEMDYIGEVILSSFPDEREEEKGRGVA